MRAKLIIGDVTQAVGGAAICLQLIFGVPGYRGKAEIRGVTVLVYTGTPRRHGYVHQPP